MTNAKYLLTLITVACLVMPLPSKGGENGAQSCKERVDAFLAKAQAQSGGVSLLDQDPGERLRGLWQTLGDFDDSKAMLDIPFAEWEFVRAYPQLKDRVFSFAEVERSFDWVNTKVNNLRKRFAERIEPFRTTERDKIKPEIKQYAKTLRAEIKKLMADPQFGVGLGAIGFFAVGAANCENLEKNLGIQCRRFLDREEILRLFQEFRSGEREVRSAPMECLLDATTRAPGILLRHNPLIRIEQTYESRLEQLNLILPVKPGQGFEGGEWASFFPQLKRAVESFWRGTLSRTTGESVEIQFSLEKCDASDAEAVVVNVAGSGSHVEAMGGNSVTLGNSSLMEGISGTENPWTMAHEFGHLLGFNDHYYSFLDLTTCESGWNYISTDIMTSSEPASISSRDLELIYRAYGKNPSENDDLLIDGIRELHKSVSKRPKESMK